VSSVWTHPSAVVNWVTADGCVVRSHRRIRRQSSRIHVHTADDDATRQNSLVASAVCIGLKTSSEVWSVHYSRRWQYVTWEIYYVSWLRRMSSCWIRAPSSVVQLHWVVTSGAEQHAAVSSRSTSTTEIPPGQRWFCSYFYRPCWQFLLFSYRVFYVVIVCFPCMLAIVCLFLLVANL